MPKKKEKFTKVDRCLWRSDSFKFLSFHAKTLFISMKDSMFDADNGYVMNEKKVPFGPRCAEGYNIKRGTYYRALKELIDAGIIEEVAPGRYGKKGIYDLTTWKRTLFIKER